MTDHIPPTDPEKLEAIFQQIKASLAEVRADEAQTMFELLLLDLVLGLNDGNHSAAAAEMRDIGFRLSARMRKSALKPTISESNPKIALPQGVH